MQDEIEVWKDIPNYDGVYQNNVFHIVVTIKQKLQKVIYGGM